MAPSTTKRQLPREAPATTRTGVATTTLPDGVRVREVPAVRRATAILRHLARHAEGMTVSHVARDLDIIPSTCLHILRELMAAHLVAFEPNGKTYRLGLGLLLLAKELSRHDVFIQTAQPLLERFAHEYGVSTSAQQRDGEESVVVAAVTASEGLEAPLGLRVALLSSASGEVYAAHSSWTPAQLRSRFDRVRWQNPPSFDAWLKDVAQVRTQGYAIDPGHFRVGVTSIAVGVPSKDGSVWRMISLGIVSAQLDAKRTATLVKALRETAANIAALVH